VFSYLFFSQKYHKVVNFLFFELVKKKIWPNHRTFLPKKLSLISQKYRFGIRDPEKTYSGSRIRGQKGPGSGSATLEYCNVNANFIYQLEEKTPVSCNMPGWLSLVRRLLRTADPPF
jgi:hypothetical protein